MKLPCQAKAFFLAAGLLWVSALATAQPESDLEALAQSYPALHRGILKYGRHLHHHSAHRRPTFLKTGHNVHHRHHESLDAGLDAELEEMPLTLPGRHPAVEKALDGMAGDLENLSNQKQAAKESRGQLEGTVTDAVHHMNDAVAIKHAMALKESQLRKENGRFTALENDVGRLDSTRANLMSSLHRMLEPKLMKAQRNFQKKKMVLQKEESAAKAWKVKKDQLKVSAIALIKQKKASYQAMLDADAEVAKAQKNQELARISYQHDNANTAEHIQSYRYAETRFIAETHHTEAAKKAALAARESAQNLYNEANVEQEHVDQSVMFRKNRLRHKIQEVEQEREKTKQEENDLKQTYRQWQEKQRERTAEVVKKSQETETASMAYAARQQQVLDTAQSKVARDAEGAGDWDGWGNDEFSKVADEDADDN